MNNTKCIKILALSLSFLAYVFLCGGCGGSGSDNKDGGNGGGDTQITTHLGYAVDSTGSVLKLVRVDKDGQTSVRAEAIAGLQNIGTKSFAQGSLYILCEAGTNLRRVYRWTQAAGKTQIGADYADTTANWSCYLIDGKNRLVAGGQVMDLTDGSVSDFTSDATYRQNGMWSDAKPGNRYHFSLLNNGDVVELDTDNDSTAVKTTLTAGACVKHINNRVFSCSGNDLVELDKDSFNKIKDILTNMGDMFFAPYPGNSQLLALVKGNGDILEVNPDTRGYSSLGSLGAGYLMIVTTSELKDTHPRVFNVNPDSPAIFPLQKIERQMQYQEADGENFTLKIVFKETNPTPSDGTIMIKNPDTGTEVAEITLQGAFAKTPLTLIYTGGGAGDITTYFFRVFNSGGGAGKGNRSYNRNTITPIMLKIGKAYSCLTYFLIYRFLSSVV